MAKPVRWTTAERRALAALLLLAAAIRIVAHLRTVVLFDDGPLFLYLAQAMASGDWTSALLHPYHPLYSATVALVNLGVGDLETAAVAVSISAGTVSVALLYTFLRDTFGAPSALIGAAILTVHPQAVDYTCDVQSEGLYMALVLAALVLCWRALQSGSSRGALWAGFVAGAAYLTRPEGVGAVLVGCAAALALAMRGTWRPSRTALWLVLLLTGLAIPIVPYVTMLRVETGQWQFSQKKSVLEMAGFESARSGEAPTLEAERRDPIGRPTPLAPRRAPAGTLLRVREAATDLYQATVSTFRFELWPFLAIGLWVCRGGPGRRGLFITSWVALYAAVLFALALSSGYVSRRHALPPLLPVLGYVALGVPVVGRALLDVARRLGLASTGARPRLAAVLGFTLIALIALPRDLRARRPERLAERRAAEWLRAHDPEPGAVVAGRLRAAYYAGGFHVPLPVNAEEDLFAYLHRHDARYLIIDEATSGRRHDQLAERSGNLNLIHRESHGEHDALVFELLPQPAEPPPTSRPDLGQKD